MARTNRSLKISDPLWDAFKHLRQKGQLYGIYPSDNAAWENLLAYMLRFRREHKMILSELTLTEQDLVHEHIRYLVLHDIDDRDDLPKPATARDLLASALQWKAEQSRPRRPPPRP